MSVLLLSWPRHDSGARADRLGFDAALGSAVLWLVGMLVERGDLGQAIHVLYTGAAARARTARPCRRAALGRLTS